MVKAKTKIAKQPKFIKIVGAIIAVIVVAAIAYQLGAYTPKDDPTAIRELLISSAGNINHPAPVDA